MELTAGGRAWALRSVSGSGTGCPGHVPSLSTVQAPGSDLLSRSLCASGRDQELTNTEKYRMTVVQSDLLGKVPGAVRGIIGGTNWALGEGRS